MAALVLSQAAPAHPQAPKPSPAEQELVLKLQNPKPAMRRDAAEQLGRLRSRAAAPDLVKSARTDPDLFVDMALRP